MVPAPMLTPSPLGGSPILEGCGTLDPRPMRDFFSSTKLPTLALAPTRLAGRRWQKGPSCASSSTVDSLSTPYGFGHTPGPRVVSATWQPVLTTHSAPTVVRPCRITPG